MSRSIEVNSHATSSFGFIEPDYDKNHRYGHIFHREIC